MAQQLGVAYCGGITSTGHYCPLEDPYTVPHVNGLAKDGVVHFYDRPVRKVSTYTFLKLVAKVRDPSLADDVPWRRIYRMDKLTRQAANELGIRLPRRLFATDRAFVLAGVAGISNDVPMRKQAFDWARR